MIAVVRKGAPATSARRTYVGRPSPLGNPFRIGPDGDREKVIAKYRHWITDRIGRKDNIQAVEFAVLLERAAEGDLELACWCAPEPCHADVLADLLRASLEVMAG